MRKTLLAVALLTLAFTVQPMSAQQKADPPKATPSSSQIVLGQWNDIGRKLTAMAEDFPEDKYDFKPTPEMRTFAEQMLHAANAMNFFTTVALGQKLPAEENPSRSQYKTKADVVAFVKKCVEEGASAIKSKGDKGMSEWMTEPFSKQQMHVSDLAYSLIEHSGEHYGQMVVYYRISGLVPPESRPKK
ncbi:MAG TPA: DinB family protein [Candidatus Acidoferrum sp.]|jgi:uncharacterized damage-inducible protein DinB